jgi:ribosomal protein S27E
MGPLDGNAMAGIMQDVFARDMTTMRYKCTGCGSTGVVAETVVYMSGPGTVARCRDCDTILVMLSERHGTYCIAMPGIAQTVFPPA